MKGIFVAAILFAALVAPSLQQCCPTLPAAAASQTTSHVWNPNQQQTIMFGVCAQITTTCGNDPSTVCGTKSSGCCYACQTWNDPDNGLQAACLGASIMSCVATSTGFTITYNGGDVASDGTPRQASLYLTCGSGSLTTDSFIPAPPSDNPPPGGAPYLYAIYAESSEICGVVGGGGKGGMIFVILLLVGFAVYFIGFALWNKFKNQAEGMEIIPHREFWSETPSLFLEGINFVKGKLFAMCGREGYSNIS